LSVLPRQDSSGENGQELSFCRNVIWGREVVLERVANINKLNLTPLLTQDSSVDVEHAGGRYPLQ